MTEPDVDALIVYYEKMRDDRTRVAKNAVTTEGRLALIASSNRAQDTATALRTLQERCKELEALIDGPMPLHRFWRAGEPDCPRDLKAPNGELHTHRCKLCGADNPRNDFCRAALKGADHA